MPVLDIDALRRNQQARVRLTLQSSVGYGKTEWISFVQDDFQVGVSADFSAPFEDFLESTSQLIGKVDVATKGKLAEVAESLGANIESARTRENTTYTWISSERPSFSVPLVFLATDPRQTPQYEAVSLAKLCMPRIQEDSANPTLLRPAGYRSGGQGSGNAPDGTFTLEIGNWFEASGLVLRDAQLSLSAQRTANGQPLYAEVQATLEPYRLVSEQEFEQYFRIGALRAARRAG